MMEKGGVKVKCKKCNRMVPVETLVLDPGYVMMVCPECVKDRKNRENVHKELKSEKDLKISVKETEKSKPVGWDAEDDYLEKARVQKTQAQPVSNYEMIDDNRAKYKCSKCKYQFIYDIAKKMPAKCPYCGTDIMKFKFNQPLTRNVDDDLGFSIIKPPKRMTVSEPSKAAVTLAKNDDYIHAAYNERVSNMAQKEDDKKQQVINQDKIKYKCIKCKYMFTYDTAKRTPSKCPYCGTEVTKVGMNMQ